MRFWQNTKLEYNNDKLIKPKQDFTLLYDKYFDEYLSFNVHWQFLILFGQSCNLDTDDYDGFAKQSILELVDLEDYQYCRCFNIIND